jgi:molybdopterin/thiamine biosynthesis adenylyltransferase
VLLVLLVAGAIWGTGWYLRTPVQARLPMIGLLYVCVLVVQVAAPAGHPLREATGGSPAPWLILGGLGAVAYAYSLVLARVRARAQDAEATRGETGPRPRAERGGPFSPTELERYARHIVLREVGGPGQLRLKEARVLVVGAGGLGSPAILYLAAAGVGHLGVIDDDTVSLSNLQRQVIHADARSGLPKVFSAQAAVRALNPHVELLPYNRRLTPEIARALVEEFDLVLDGSDSFETRAAVNAACVAAGRPLVAGAIAQWEGQVTVYDPTSGAPCLACVFPRPPAPGQAPSCAEAGVVGALPGVVGSMMAMEAVKLVTAAGTPLRGAMLIYDGLEGDARRITIARRADCPVCGHVAAGRG